MTTIIGVMIAGAVLAALVMAATYGFEWGEF